jgi:PIN domain nuclease of toxin-antitoxin system
VGEVNLLLDTHVFLWSKANDRRMSSSAWGMLRDPNNQLYLSAISVVEMAIKTAIGKLTLDIPLADLVLSGMKDAGIIEVELRSAHGIRLATLPQHHRDPFDRLLVATALEESLILLTNDAEIRKYDAKVAW